MKKNLLCIMMAVLMLVSSVPLNLTAFGASDKKAAALSVVKQPESVTVANGKTAKLSVKAKGTGLKYTWYYKDAGMSSFKKTDAFKTNTYAVKMNAARDGRKLYCKVTDKNGKYVKTKVAAINMQKELRISKQPVSVTVANGKTAKLTIKAYGDGLKYVWYYRDTDMSAYQKTNTFKGVTYSVKMNSDRDGRKVYCRITDKYGKSVRTNIVTLNMRKKLSITAQPVSVSVPGGNTAKVSVKAYGNGLKYTWYYKDTGMTDFKKTDAFTGSTYSVTMNAIRNGRQVYCKVTDQYEKSVKTNTVTLNMKRETLSIDCADCLKKTSGTSFNSNTVYSQTNKIDKMPLTFEAVFRLKKSDLDVSTMLSLDRRNQYTETVLFSNDDTFESCISFSVTEDGHPKLGLRHKDWFRYSYNFLFDKVNVFSDTPIHMAITLDHSGDNVHCYINGKLMQTLQGIPEAVKVPFIPICKYVVGGDLYGGNPNFFRGELYSMSIWSDVRTASEIKSDFSKGADTSDKALLASYDFYLCDKCMRKDFSLNQNNLVPEKLWQGKDEVEALGEYDYSFAVIGDTQELSEDDPEAFTALYEWIVDNKEEQKIEYVLGLGDITQKSYAHEWEHAQKQIYKMNDVVPYLLARGNHDYDILEDGIVTAGFNKTFDDGVYNKQLTGVMTEGDVSNAYRTINICGIDYLFLTLDFGPNAEMLEWADSVVEAHPNHRVIVTTHGYLYRDGTTLDSEDAYPASRYPLKTRKEEQEEKPSLDGDDIWTDFASKHQNIQLVLSGHDPCQHVVYRQDKGENNNTVTQMLIDPQGFDGFCGSTATVAMFYFSNNGNTLTVRYYSVVKDMYGSESSQFTIELS